MKAALLVLDGWGIADHDDRRADDAAVAHSRDHRDAVRAAHTPNVDRYRESGAYGTLTTAGRDVGLPRGQMGNSEVGHLTIGAGRVVLQEYTKINDAIADGVLCENDAIADAFEYAAANGGRVHLMGLVSDGGVHADHEHLHALIECAASRDLPATTHAFTDGRDTSPTGGESYLYALQEVVDEYGTGDVATVTGRYYAMDRDQNWERTKAAYDAIVDRNGLHRADTAVEAVTDSYERGDTDEFVEPTIVRGGDALSDGDAVVFCNFRADRARQLVRLLGDVDPVWPFETDPPETYLATMTEYDQTFDFPVAFPPTEPENTLGEVIAREGLTQLRVAESEKYPHVTYFLNGGREVAFEGEVRRIVESPDVPTYDLQPEMSATAVVDTTLETIRAEDPDVLVLNFANADMVGHTGDYEAAITAVETVDTQLGRLVDFLETRDAHVLVTADHGNADDMGAPDDPHTAHTFNPVPFIYRDPAGTDGGKRVRDGGALRDLAPTLLGLLGIDPPTCMTGTSLLVADR
jgi:2,3-bisphosphoglycerate-independent phosphoglycerate mutase